jgi:hypothetical protein
MNELRAGDHSWGKWCLASFFKGAKKGGCRKDATSFRQESWTA